ncbi:MAG: hypothetical protein EOP11_13630, partial [Proteobacteria bacterium]
MHLVLNQKTVRLVEAKDTFSAELLERIKSKGYSHLEIQHEGDNLDPNTFPLYLNAEISNETPIGITAETSVDLENSRVAANKTTEDSAVSIKADAAKAPESQRLESNIEIESSQRIKASNEVEESTRVSGISAEDSELNSIRGELPPVSASSGISISAQEEEESTSFAQTKEPPADATLSGAIELEEETNIGGSSGSAPAVFKVKSDSESD